MSYAIIPSGGWWLIMDNIDMKLIKLLEEKGRLSHEEISKLLHVSRPAIHQRVGKLEKSGLIKGYRAIVNWGQLGQKIKALIFVKLNLHNFAEAMDKIIDLEIPNVSILECQRLAGEWCIMLKVRVTAPEDITRLIDAMVKTADIQETSTTFILSTLYEDGIKS